MKALHELKFLALDTQTTGMRPPSAHLLEIGWAIADASTQNAPVSLLAQLPEGVKIPRRVSEITGLKDADLGSATTTKDIGERLRQTLRDTAPHAAIIHYAQFEKPFLMHLLGEEFPLPIICMHQLTKRLLPNLPSQNIRAVAGYFGPAVIGVNRAATFVRATIQIWQGLQGELKARKIEDWEALNAFLSESTSQRKKNPKRYEYRIDRLKRLELPEQPGVYRMLSQTGEVLYVGKATSLKSRVNSYFRGQKGREPRKLEMLAQVWDLNVTTCSTPLEAALLESDEIKRFDPPYNVALKRGNRCLVFYSRDFARSSTAQDRTFPIGPFRQHSRLESLQALENALKRLRETSESQPQSIFENIFYTPLEPSEIFKGWLFWRERTGQDPVRVRNMLAVGMMDLRKNPEPENEEEVQSEQTKSEPTNEERIYTTEEIADKFSRLFRSSAKEYLRSKQLTKLLNSDITIGSYRLHIEKGLISTPETSLLNTGNLPTPWSGLDIDTYDRMSIVLSELQRTPR